MVYLFLNLKNTTFKLLIICALGFWLISLTAMLYRNSYILPPRTQESLIPSPIYAQEGKHEFRDNFILSLVECLIIAAVLIPYSFSRHFWIRLFILLCFFGFLMAIMIVTGGHSTRNFATVAVWNIFLNGILFVIFIGSIVSEYNVENKQRRLQKNDQWDKFNSKHNPNN